MTNAHSEAPDRHQIEQFVQLVFEAASEAASAGGWSPLSLRLAGEDLLIRTSGAAADTLPNALTHRASEIRAASRPLRIDVIDTSGSSRRLPATTWPWHRPSYRCEDWTLDFDPDRRMLVAADAALGRAAVWLETGRLAAWELAAPLRPTLDRLLAPRGHTMVHAASVGQAGATVLLAGPGGSGKSTTVSAALDRGFDTVGDDFLLLPASTTGIVESLYRTMRLHHSSPRFDPRRHTVHDDGFGNGKALAFIDEDYPGQLVERQRVAALVAPTLSGRPRSQLRAVGAAEVLRALVPSSLLLADRRPEALGRLVALARAVPTYHLEAGTDLGHLVDTVASLLDPSRLTSCAS